MEIGYIYVMKMDNYYKIGKTKNKKRLGEYTKLPTQPEYPILIKVSDFHDLERKLHTNYIDKRTRNNCEWYILTENDIEEIRMFLKKYEIIEEKNDKEEFFYRIAFDYKNGLSVDNINFHVSICQRKLYTDEYHCSHCGGNDLYLKRREKKNGADTLTCKKCDRFVRFANDEIRQYYTPEYCGGYKYEGGEIETYKYYTVKNGFRGCYSDLYFEDSDINFVHDDKFNNKYIGYGKDIKAMVLKIVYYISLKIDENYNAIKEYRNDIEKLNGLSKELVEYVNG